MNQKEYFDGLLDAFQPLLLALKELRLQIDENAPRILEKLNQFYQEISWPASDEAMTQNLINCCKKWAQYGWTPISSDAIHELYKSPAGKEEADATMQQYCYDNNVNRIFDDLIRNEDDYESGFEASNLLIGFHNDIEEAIADYREKRYKSCAMLLFSMIDCELISFQKDEDRDRRSRRPSGSIASANISKRISKNRNIDIIGLHMLFENTFAACAVFFADGKDFIFQPDVINRNFLDHGMMTKEVTRQDCLQLFALFINITSLLTIYIL